MKTVMKHIWKISTVIFILMLFTISGCKDDPTSPEEKEKEKPKATTTIGPGGGTVGTEDVSITIPAGAFSADHEIAISEVTEQTFGENAVSKPYKISGLPIDFSRPLRVTLKFQGTLSDEKYMGFGRVIFNNVTADSSVIYSLETASDSSGHLVSYLPISLAHNTTNLNKIADGLDNFDVFLNGLADYKEQKTNNFIVRYPKNSDESNITDLATRLEDTQNKLILLGLQKTIAGKWEAVVKQLKSSVFGEDGLLNISKELVNSGEITQIGIDCGNELLESVIRSYFDKYSINNFWFITALETWAEEMFSLDQNFKYPQGFADNFLAPFNGMRAGAGNRNGPVPPIPSIEINHGKGMSAMIKYLMDNNKLKGNGLIDIFEKIKTGSDPVTALLNSVNVYQWEWWPDFFKEYISGNIYDQPIDKFLANAEGEWNINTSTDILKEFKSGEVGHYPDLSAKMFKINLSHSNFKTTDNLLLSMIAAEEVYDELSLVVFGIQSNYSEYLGTTNSQDFRIENLKSYVDRGMKQFLVVLVNSNSVSNDYMGTSNIDLIVTVEKKLDYTKCGVYLKVLSNIRYVYLDDSQKDSTSYETWESRMAVGSFTGNTFTGNYNEYGYSGEITVTLNATQDTVSNLTFSGIYDKDSRRINKAFSVENIPQSPYDENRFRWESKNDNSCDVITAIDFNWLDGWGYNGVNTMTLINYICDENAIISIYFGNE